MYTSPEVASAFEAFWQNKNNIQDRFFDYWRVVANRFKNSESVLGYDIINEPFAANLQKYSMMFFEQQKFDRELLTPFYQQAVEVIRKEDSSHFVFFEPAQFPGTIPLFGGIIADVGFSQNPGGQEFKNRAVLDEHLYCCLMEAGVCDSGEPPMAKISECRKFHMRKMAIRK